MPEVPLTLVGLFLAALLAGSALPFPSEPVLVALLVNGAPAGAAVAVATLGNVLGAATLYALGRGGARWLGPRLAARLRGDPAGRERALERVRRWGAPALALGWVPIVGDPLVLAAGLAGVRPVPFMVWVTLGKAARYAAVAASTLWAAT